MNLFEAIFAHNSAAPAIHFQGRDLTYGELRARTLRMAQVIQSLGTAPGDRVALLLNDSPEFIEAFIAICSLGAVAVPINMSLRLDEQCSILHNSGTRLALAEDDIRNTLLTDAREKLRCSIYSLKSVLEKPGDTASIHFPTPGENDPAFILYTSGSTGEPKGAVHRQADIFYTNQTFCREVLGVTKDDRLFSSSRLPFAYGLGNSFTFPLLNGATTILCSDKPTPGVIASIIATARPTIFFAVPVVYNLLLDHHRSGRQLDCSSLRLCVSAGEALPAHLGEEWEREFGVQLLDGIG